MLRSSPNAATSARLPTGRVDRFFILLIAFVLLVCYTFCPSAVSRSVATWRGQLTGSHPSQEMWQKNAAVQAGGIDTQRFDQFNARRKVATLLQGYTDDAGGDEEPTVSPVRRRHSPDDEYTLVREQLVHYDPDFPHDSTAETLMIKPDGDRDLSSSYHVCSFTNVCAAPDGILFRFQNHTAWKEMEQMATKCADLAVYWKTPLCHCFHYAFKPLLLPYEFKSEVTTSIASTLADPMEAEAKLERAYPDPFAHVAASDHSHYWSVHKWVSHHHIAHWAQKLMIFQSIWQHHRTLDGRLPALTGLVFHDTSATPPLEEHLLNIFNISMEAALAFRDNGEWRHPALWKGEDSREQMDAILDPEKGRLIWHDDLVSGRYATSKPLDACKAPDSCLLPNPAWRAALEALPADGVKTSEVNGVATKEPVWPITDATGQKIPRTLSDPSVHTCFARLSMSPMYGILSLDPKDADAFRAATAKLMGTVAPATGTRTCPPKRAILLTRSDRKILNVAELRAWMQQEYRIDLELHEVTGRNTSKEQIALFGTTGLILSSHSSQLINVLFSHPGQSLVEITPEFYNVDFAAYAHALGLNFNYALGGAIPRDAREDAGQSKDYTYVDDPLMVECTSGLLAACPTGDSWCLIQQSPALCSRIIQWPNKQMNFYANMTAIKLAVQSSMAHIEDRCFGKWNKQ